MSMPVCPNHRSELKNRNCIVVSQGVPWPDGEIICPDGCVFMIEGGIPRFVPRDNYASAFGLQWRRYQKTQLDSYTGQSYSRQRLERCLGMQLSALKDKVVLECGAGAGRFTELLVDNCRLLVSIDISDAVDANLRNCAGKKPYILLQADINKSPLPFRYFDLVVCLGVIQHTPSPEQTIASLAQHVKPGGLLVIDHYAANSWLELASGYLSLAYPLSAVLKRLSPALGLKSTIALTAICDPIRRRTCNNRILDRIASRLFPSACYYKSYPLLGPKLAYEWNELDTHDKLTSYYRHHRSAGKIRDYLINLGFRDVACELAGNGVEARAVFSGVGWYDS